MKIKLYIVSFIDMNCLKLNLDSLFKSDLMKYNHEIFIISNHSSFSLPANYLNRVKVLRNVLRPDFSTGHLARNWNEAIVNGFKDLNNPDCDILITAQDDSIFEPDFMGKLINLHKKYNFITAGIGDNVISYQQEAIKKIGLWDERFCGIYYQEGDYFLRALMYNKDKSCINDWPHDREINPIAPNARANTFLPIARRTIWGNNSYGLVPGGAAKHMSVMRKHFENKWPGIKDIRWSDDLKNNPPKKPAIPEFVMYPYFEKDIENLNEKGYDTEFSSNWFIK